MDVSSMTSRSQSRGFWLSRRKPPVRGSTSSSRWIFAERMRRMALTRGCLAHARADHGCFVDDEQVAVEGVLAIAPKAASPGIDFEQPVDLCREDAQDGVDEGLSCPRQGRPWMFRR